MLLACCLFLVQASTAQKSVSIVEWNFFSQKNGGTDNLTPTNLHADLSATGLIRGKGLTAIADKTSGYWGASNFSVSQEGPEEAIEKEKFITFSITSNGKKTLSLKEIKPMKIRIFSVGPINYLVQYSTDGTNFNEIAKTKVDRPEKQSDLLIPSINLSNIRDLQNIENGKTVQFRIVPWGASRQAFSHFYLGSKYDVPSLSIVGGFNK